MKNPFKFLDAYTIADKDDFFGRDYEKRHLYQQLRSTSIVLLYGFSGTGKTSLVQCGLSQYYDGPDWHPFIIRKGEDINTSTVEALQSVLQEPLATNNLNELVYEVFITYLRPVYLIFDQFEEIFTLDTPQNAEHNKAVRKLFFQRLFQLQTQNMACKVIIIIREEYLGRLYEYEQYCPTLFNFKLRVEALNTEKLKEVLGRTFARFNIETEPISLTQTITQNLLDGNATSQLAYLQVYLSRLWETAETAIKEGKEYKIIKTKTLETVGDVKNVLDLFLTEQENKIAQQVSCKPEDVRNILDCFVTDEGTKRPHLITFDFNKNLNQEQLETCLQLLQEARLIRQDDRYYELAHDTLASIIEGKRNSKQLLIKNLKQNIIFSKSQNSPLDANIIKAYDEVKEIANFEDNIVSYVNESKSKNNIKNFLWGILQVGVVIALLIAVVMYNDAQESNKKTEQALVTKEITDYNIMLNKINVILVNSVNCPDSVMLATLKEMELKCKNNPLYKANNEFVTKVQETTKRLENSNCK